MAGRENVVRMERGEDAWKVGVSWGGWEGGVDGWMGRWGGVDCEVR